MGQTVCRYSSKQKDYVCGFETWDFIHLATTPYGDVPFIINSICLIVMMVMVMVSIFIKYVDFTTSYITTILIPMIVRVFCAWFFSLRQYWNMPHFIENIAQKGKSLATNITDVLVPLGTLIFLFMNLVTAYNRKEHGGGVIWTPFIISLIVACGASIYVSFDRSYYYSGNFIFWYSFVIYCLHGACLLLILVIPFVACCCSGAKPGQSSSPVVANAKSRMLWTIVFCLCALLPSLATKVFIGEFEYNDRLYWHFYTIYQFVAMIYPIIICFAALLFLPAYRSALCCSQGYARGEKVSGNGNKPTKTVQPIPVQNQPQAVIPTAPTQPIQAHVDQNLIAYLNNPSIAPPLPNQRMPPAQPVVPCPNCVQIAACQAGHIHQQATLQKVSQDMGNFVQIPQQPVAYQTFAMTPVQQQAFVAQPTTLVRFASQPNLVQFNGMQPSVSMPHLVAAQNPFYIHS